MTTDYDLAHAIVALAQEHARRTLRVPWPSRSAHKEKTMARRADGFLNGCVAPIDLDSSDQDSEDYAAACQLLYDARQLAACAIDAALLAQVTDTTPEAVARHNLNQNSAWQHFLTATKTSLESFVRMCTAYYAQDLTKTLYP